MRTSLAQADHAAPFPIFAVPPVGDLAAAASTSVSASFGPMRSYDGQALVSATAAHAHFDRETVVNRLLDWAVEARERGRVKRADYLVCLAWDAYDRVPC